MLQYYIFPFQDTCVHKATTCAPLIFFSRVIVPVDQTLPFSSTTLFTFAYFGSKMQSKPQVKKKNVLNASYSGEMHKYLNNKHYLLKAA